MGALGNLVDIVLFIFFLSSAIGILVIDAQICLPQHLFPPFLVELKSWYTQFSGDYLVAENPHFVVGLVWLELIFQWPLAIASLYGIAAGKSWSNTTCLLYGASTITTWVAILAELTRSNRASDMVLKIYFLQLGCSVLALLRGLKSVTIGKRPLLQTKKRA
ncbi:hypothetical protein C2S51_003971 [Perilla frutescens var. frutescens]|nr:hypothetical protein C2S51_003971 [Perilla frutescens var. frutescens]